MNSVFEYLSEKVPTQIAENLYLDEVVRIASAAFGEGAQLTN